MTEDKPGGDREELYAPDPDGAAEAVAVAAHPAIRIIDTVWEVAGVVAMVAVTLLIFLNASARYLFAGSIGWADEVVIGLIPWIAMIGVYLSIRRGSVIRIEYFFCKFPPRVQPVLTVFTTLLSAAAFIQLAFYSYQYVGFFGTDPTPYLGIMRGWFTSSMLVGATACGLLFLVDAFRPMRRSVAERPDRP